ncbi:RdxH [Jannaschia pagri]|uniref:RdxH n=1 Tax=Jannaschia pagri TaxID=2829797 RepID=A0ABQ4NJX4_9RHOB|nr:MULTISPECIES: FixH family protein [unclassified Jannaschia]GIT90819.1 RdxH [Jannaschia sp. AI_61]GIT94651.1 RdxH [Jannaschia sp. AI_62]
MTVLTGRKVLGMFVLGFGTIITVNLTLAYNAVHTFPGLETKNSYVASQAFDRDRAAQEALGWTATVSLQGTDLQLDLRDRSGAPITDVELGGILGRATNVADDQHPVWWFDGDTWHAHADLEPGNWDLRLVATRGTDRFRKRLKVRVVR